MTEQEQKAVEEYAKKASQIDTLIISNSLNEIIKAYNEGVHNGILMGAQFLDTLRKVGEPDKGLLEALEQIANAPLPFNEFEYGVFVHEARRIACEAISNYEKTDQMTYSDYVRKDLAIEFVTRFYQLMTSARVDEYIGARKDVCVNDLFEEFIKTKEDEKP